MSERSRGTFVEEIQCLSCKCKSFQRPPASAVSSQKTKVKNIRSFLRQIISWLVDLIFLVLTPTSMGWNLPANCLYVLFPRKAEPDAKTTSWTVPGTNIEVVLLATAVPQSNWYTSAVFLDDILFPSFTRPQQHLRFHRCLTFQNRVKTTRRLKSSEVWGTGWGTGMKSFGLVMSEVCHLQMTCHMLSYPMSTMSCKVYSCILNKRWLKFGLSNMHVKITSGPTSGRRGMSTPCLGALFYRTGDSVGASATAGRLWT